MISFSPSVFAGGCQSAVDKMSVAQLERFVSFMVLCTSESEDGAIVARPPEWWPSEVVFRHPVLRLHEEDYASWRTTLRDLVARCYSFHSLEALAVLSAKLSKHELEQAVTPLPQQDHQQYQDKSAAISQTSPPRRKRVLISSNSENSAVGILGVASPNKQEYLKKVDRHSVPSKLPVVSLSDIVKERNQDKKEAEKAAKPPTKNEFLQYFKLKTSSDDSPVVPISQYKGSHQVKLWNSPNIPFSSNIGLRLIRETPPVPEQSHVRRVERVERYLRSGTPCLEDNNVYEVSYNRTGEKTHIYKFPSRQRRRKERLALKMSLQLNVCRPCYVKMEEGMEVLVKAAMLAQELKAKIVFKPLSDQTTQPKTEEPQEPIHIEDDDDDDVIFVPTPPKSVKHSQDNPMQVQSETVQDGDSGVEQDGGHLEVDDVADVADVIVLDDDDDDDYCIRNETLSDKVLSDCASITAHEPVQTKHCNSLDDHSVGNNENVSVHKRKFNDSPQQTRRSLRLQRQTI